jgi:hypothetical protein
MSQYYVQVIAANYLKNLVDQPAQMKVCKSYLHGLEEDEFQSGFCELLSTVRMLYSDIASNPRDFDMLLKQNAVPDAKNTDYTQSHASFLRIPNLLFLIGYCGELQPDMTVMAGHSINADVVHLCSITSAKIRPIIALNFWRKRSGLQEKMWHHINIFPVSSCSLILRKRSVTLSIISYSI